VCAPSPFNAPADMVTALPRRGRSLVSMRVLAAVVFVLPLGARALSPDSSVCANDLLGAIDDIANAAYDMVQAASDCTLPGLSELSCASDLTDMMNNLFATGQVISDSTISCGDLDNTCSSDITMALADITDVSNNLVAAVSDCIASPFLCTYDVLTSLDSLNSFVGDVMAAIGDCNQGAAEPSPEALNVFFNAQDNARGQRRLQEDSSAGAAVSAAAGQGESAAAQGLQAPAPPGQLAPKSVVPAPAQGALPTTARPMLSPSALGKFHKAMELSAEVQARLKDRLKGLTAEKGAPGPAGDRQVVV